MLASAQLVSSRSPGVRLEELVAVPIDVWGIPLIVVYLFGVWLALILSAVWLSRRLVHRSPPDGARAMAGIDVPEQQPPQGPR